MNPERQIRELSLDELLAVSGGKTAIGVRVENCTTKFYADGREVQKT